MNRFGLNKSSLNGVIYALVLATASIDCSASVNAVAIRDAEALAPVSSAAYVTADPTVTRYVAANLDGVGGFYPIPTHTHASQAQAGGSAEIVAYVLRDVQGVASIQCGAEIIAVVASTMATGAVDSGADVTADATRVQAARSSATGICGVEISIEPTGWRMARCTASLGTASVRAETAIKLSGASFFTHETYAVAIAGAEVITAEVLIREVGATLVCDASASGVGTIRQPGRANAVGSAAIVNAEPNVVAIPFVQLGCSAALSATALKKLIPANITLAGTGDLTGTALQKHAAQVSILDSAELVASGLATRHASVVLTGDATATGTALRILKPVSNPSGGATVVVTALRTVEPASSPSCAAEVTADGVRWLIPDNITLASTAAMTASADKLFYPASDMACAATLAADAVRVCVADAAAFGSANLYPDWRNVTIGKIAVASMIGTGSITATALRTVLPSITLENTASFTADGVRHVLPTSSIASSADMSAEALLVKKPTANIDCSAEINAPASTHFLGFPVANIDCSAEIAAQIAVWHTSTSLIAGTAEIYADSVCNPESYDPPERTFTRTVVVLEFVRPFQETEFRRVA
jgi:hypothetical protein